MKFANKTFAALAIATNLAIASVTLLEYRVAMTSLERQYVSHYVGLGRTIVGAFMQTERAADIALLNAARVFKDVEAKTSLSTPAELDALAASLNISALGYYDGNGDSVAFSNHANGKGLFNIFDLCTDYQSLLYKPGTSIITPFARNYLATVHGIDSQKYAYVASEDRTRILTAALRSNYMVGFLRDVTASDPHILKTGLYSPNGTELAVESKPGSEKIALSGDEQDVQTFHEGYRLCEGTARFGFTATASTPTCCECVQKGQALATDAYHYVFKMAVARTEVTALQHQMRLRAFWTCAVGALLSLVVSRVLAHRLSSRLISIAATARTVNETKNLTHRVMHDNGGDEVSDVAKAFNAMLQALQEGDRQRIEMESVRSIAKVASQVAHDIRSPVAALQAVSQFTLDLPEEVRLLMRDAIRRINDIANNLLTQHRQRQTSERRSPTSRQSSELLAPLLHSVVSEQRLLTGQGDITLELEINAGAYAAFSVLDLVGFRRALSNLLNNSREAVGAHGEVLVRMSCDVACVYVEVSDNGKGIAASDIERVLRGGVSVGKEGHGLGLSGARTAVEGWGGTLTLTSTVGAGTKVRIELPRAEPAAWFASQIKIAPETTVVVLDDDDAIGRVWDERIKPFTVSHGVVVRKFKQTQAFVAWMQANRAAVSACLLDYELAGQCDTGLDVAKDLNIGYMSTLITSHYEDSAIRSATLEAGMRIVPKSYGVYVPIRVTQSGAP